MHVPTDVLRDSLDKDDHTNEKLLLKGSIYTLAPIKITSYLCSQVLILLF